MSEREIFLAALEHDDPRVRLAFLDEACAGDPALRAKVEDLLKSHEQADSFLVEPAAVAHDMATSPQLNQGGADRTETPDETGASRADLPATYAMTGAHVAENPPTSEMVAGERRVNAQTLADPAPALRPGPFVPGQVVAGRYTLLEILGEGGMGTVYKAEQSQPVKRQVALKLIKVGMDSRSVLARFDAERQALAMMDHPNIARVYDGGATEANQPFFVMEFVQGVPITDYCDQHRLSVDARLQLFVAVCQAVQHAHQKGIIHRDLKPSNVMVTEVDGRPTPKVIDFGVAKATESNLTDQSLGDTGAIVGTPTYMSPEQADPSSMDIDTRTDVYALGVILYELLAGSTPLDATQFKRGALLEMLRMVREVDPSKPSTKVSTADALPNIAANRGIDPERLKRQLRGDLDWIVMKALEKDRTRRYETANGFGADILRHLASEPVLAAPPSRSYRLRKFARKHRAGVIAASLVLLALVAGVAGTTLGLLEARRSAEAERLAKLDAQENEKKAVEAAEEERKAKETVEDVLGFVETKVFAAARPKDQKGEGGLGYDVKLADAISAALPAIEKSFPDKPLTEARLRRTIGFSFWYLGKQTIAVEQFEAALRLFRRELGPDHPDTLNCMHNLAGFYANLGRPAEAVKLVEETLALTKAKLGPDHPDTLTSMNNLANNYAALGRPAEALKLHEETLALRKAKLGPDHPDTLTSMNHLAISYAVLGRDAEGLKLVEEALALQKAKLGPDHPDTLRSMNNLALSYSALHQHAEAAKLREETLALTKAKLGPDHPATLTSMNHLANSYTVLGRLAEAAKLREETLALTKAKLGPDHPDTLGSMNNEVHSYAVLGRRAEAVKLGEETLALTKAKLGPDHPATLGSMHNLANIYTALGRHAEALKLHEETLALRKTKLGPDHPDTLQSMNNLANSYTALGRHAEADKLRGETLALTKAKLGPDHPETLVSMYSVADSYMTAGRTREALSLMLEYSTAAPKDTMLSMKLAALQAWFGQDKELAVTRQRILANAKGTEIASTAERAALVCSLLPTAGKEELDAAIVLARRAVDLGKDDEWLDYFLMALGMAGYRSGHFAEAEVSLSKAVDHAKGHPHRDGSTDLLAGTSAFYRAMSLFRQGKIDEARTLATEAAAKMWPLPSDEQNPMGGVVHHVHLILWLAYKEAKALIGFDAPPAAPAKPDGK